MLRQDYARFVLLVNFILSAFAFFMSTAITSQVRSHRNSSDIISVSHLKNSLEVWQRALSTLRSRNAEEILSKREINYFSDVETDFGNFSSFNRTFNEQKFDISNKFYINASNCKGDKSIDVFSEEGYLFGVVDGANIPDVSVTCFWKITVPERYSMLATVEMLEDQCSGTASIDVSDDETLSEEKLLASIDCSAPRLVWNIFTTSNHLFFRFQGRLVTPGYTIAQFQLSFISVIKSRGHFLPVIYDSVQSGYIISHSFSEESKHASCYLNASFQLEVPAQHTVMISFKSLFNPLSIWVECSDAVNLFTIDTNRNLNLEWSACRVDMATTRVYNTSLVVNFISDGSSGGVGFKVLFSIHPEIYTPLLSDTGLFDCSVPYYVTFKRHLECNLEPECQDGIDEENCPFSSPSCNGSLAFGSKCYTYHHLKDATSWDQARSSCQHRGGNLAMIKSSSERDAIRKMISYGKNLGPAFVGLTLDYKRFNYGAGSLYANLWHWVDGTVAYNANISGYVLSNIIYCSVYVHSVAFHFIVTNCNFSYYTDYICEKEMKNGGSGKKINVDFPKSKDLKENFKLYNTTIVRCPDGYVTHDFLTCLPESFCGEVSPSHWCSNSFVNIFTTLVMTTAVSNSNDLNVFTRIPMFGCTDGKQTLHYTMVCDFKPDCIDGSDENFCQYDHQCPEYTCLNSQCISFKQVCDRISHCWDGSDEEMCSGVVEGNEINLTRNAIPPPAIIDFDFEEKIIRIPLHPSSPCPVTHFRCHGELSYCLPVYLRCNGVYDCPDGEDEDDCKRYVCPGLYRCFNSSVCVHVDHLCDGWPQCPERDDEMLCGFRCPVECRCQGLAFICHHYFPVAAYPDVRYLDAGESKLSVSDVSKNTKLVWLRLSRCNIKHVHEMLNPNLQFLDLSDNLITSVDLNVFYKLSNLVELNLAGNPIMYLKQPTSNIEHSSLQRLDLSRTAISLFDSTLLKSFRHINFLNISHGNIEAIGESGFNHLPELKTLDIRGNTLEIFSKDLLTQMPQLEVIFAENYKFCCKAMLPELFHEDFCFAPKDEISSCEDLLRSNVYRVFNWIVASMTVVGNAGCFVFRVFVQKVKSMSGYRLFVINLSVADFMIGLYLTLVGGADLTYLGKYLWNEHSWKASRTCKLAGFSSLVSIEVSSMIIFLIMIDRYIVLRFPFSKIFFQRKSAALACGIAWIIGIMLATIPLLPMMSHWQFYGRTGICVPLPLTRQTYPGKTYSFVLIIMFNFVMFILIAVGQSLVYMSIQVNSMTTNTTRKSKDSTIARRLICIVFSNFLCSFPIGFVGLLASVGTPVPSEVNVAMAIFVLPLNAALNPFTYTFNTLAEKRRKSKEQELLIILKDSLQSEKTKNVVVMDVE